MWELTGIFKPVLTYRCAIISLPATPPPPPGGQGWRRGRSVIQPCVWRGFIRKGSERGKPKMSLESILVSRFLVRTTFHMSETLWRLRPTKLATPKPVLHLSKVTAHYLLSPGVCTSSTPSLTSARWAWLSRYCQSQWPAPPSRSASRVANSKGWSDQLQEENRNTATEGRTLKLDWPDWVYWRGTPPPCVKLRLTLLKPPPWLTCSQLWGNNSKMYYKQLCLLKL